MTWLLSHGKYKCVLSHPIPSHGMIPMGIPFPIPEKPVNLLTISCPILNNFSKQMFSVLQIFVMFLELIIADCNRSPTLTNPDTGVRIKMNHTAKFGFVRYVQQGSSKIVKKKNITLRRQLGNYFDSITHTNTNYTNTLTFWCINSAKFHFLYKLAIKVLSVPATSAPIERLFSTEALMIRPHRSRIGSDLLSALTTLKSNYDLKKKTL